jgi:hypothetical protein
MVDGRIHVSGDHRGVFLMVGLLGYALDINVYDTRHGEDLEHPVLWKEEE